MSRLVELAARIAATADPRGLQDDDAVALLHDLGELQRLAGAITVKVSGASRARPTLRMRAAATPPRRP